VRAKNVAQGYVVTKALDDFGVMAGLQQTRADGDSSPAQIMRIPAPFLDGGDGYFGGFWVMQRQARRALAWGNKIRR
jgi:hypothetical protein